MAPGRWYYEAKLVEDTPENEISTDNILKSPRRRKPPGGVSDNTLVQKSESNRPRHGLRHGLRRHEQLANGRNAPHDGIESTTVECSTDARSMGKKTSGFHLDTPMTEGVSDSERLPIPEEVESVIVVERTPKRAKKNSSPSEAANRVSRLSFNASEVYELERSNGYAVTGVDTTAGDVSSAETSSPSFSQANLGSTRSSTRRPNKASCHQSPTGTVGDGLINAPNTLAARPHEGSGCGAVVNSASSTSATDLSISTKSLNEELTQNNLTASILQRPGQTSPSTGFHGQSSLDDSQSTLLLLDQTPQQRLRSSFHQTTPQRQLQSSFGQFTDSLKDKSSVLQAQDSSTTLPSTPAFRSTTPLNSSHNASHLSDSKYIATSQVNTSTTIRQDQRTHNPLITDAADMAEAGTRQSSAVELDSDNSSVLSDLDSNDFTEEEAALILNSHQPNTPPAKSRPPRQKNQTPKRPRGRPPKEKNVLQKAADHAKVVTKKSPARPRPPKGASRAAGRKKKVDGEDETDDFQPGKDLGSAVAESGVGLRDRSKLKAPVTYGDQVAAIADLMQRPGAKSELKMVVSTKKSGKARATRASATPSNVRTPSRKKAAPSAPRTPGVSKKAPPNSSKYTEPRPSPHDSGFSEVASTDDEQVLSDFTPPSSSSSDSSQESSVISPSSPEEDVEEDIVEPSSPEVPLQRVKKTSGHFATDITVEDADSRTDPPVGPELVELAQKARLDGHISKRWNPEVARRVDKIWMAPAMCDSCRAGTRDNCDRAYPCSSCAKKGRDCNIRTVMMRSACNKNPEYNGAITTLHLNAPMVSQSGDGTWNSIKQSPPTIRPQKRKWGDSSKDTAKSKGRRAVATTRDKRLSNGTGRPGEISQHLKAPHIVQNGDATWNLTEQAGPASNRLKQKRKYAGASGNLSAKKQHRSPASGYSSSEETYVEDPAKPGQALARSKKGPRAYNHYHQSEQENLPAPYGQPPVWASKRQQLCETLPYYRAYMSGGYLHDGLVRAILIDKEIRERDVFEEEVVITRCGGGRKLDEATNKMVQTTDQERSAYGLGFERARDMHSPVAIIAGQGNSKSPSKLPHYYNILDWFHVTDVWVEKVEGYKTWCVRIEKIRLDEKSWWAKAGSTLPSPYRDLGAIKAASGKCCLCGDISKAIFEQGWVCLKASCDKFFVFDSPIDDRKLIYTETFLKERTAYTGDAPGPLAPPLMTEADMIITGKRGTEFAFKQGIVCPLCKGCSRRKQWSKWICETVGCGFTHSLPIQIMSVKDTMSDIARNHRQQNFEPKFGIKLEEKTMGAYNVFEYGVPGPKGNIVGVLRLFKSSDAINSKPDGPNDLFRLMQESDFDLQRRPVRQPNSSGEVLTNHFATNWGAPYKFVVAQSSRGFSEAPIVIVKALKRLTWAGEQTLTDVGEPFHPFNELLSIGYFQDCSIGYHDDGESTLGPTVATLSLGASATMSLRPKAKAAVGVTSKNAKGTKAPVIRVTLEHGDMVIMHGSGVQTYYEHEVVPHGTLRFALTSRYIQPAELESDAVREEARIKGALPEGHEQYKYDGDENVIFSPEEMKKAEKVARIHAFMRSVSDAVAIRKAIESQGDDDELCQMRNILGEHIRGFMGDELPGLMSARGNGALAPGGVGESICRKENVEKVDVPMTSAL